MGQAYKIMAEVYTSDSVNPVKKQVGAKLIFEGKYFYTFEYMTKSGDMLRTTIDKFDYKRNPKLIKEEKNENRKS